MKQIIGKYEFSPQSYLGDLNKQVTLATIGNYLIDVASRHAVENGFGFDDMLANKTAWVLSRMAIEFDSYPNIYDTITIYTWIEDVSSRFTTRCFELQNGEKQTIAYARTIWAAIDLETRRPTRLDNDELLSFVTERACPIEKSEKIPAIDQSTCEEAYRVKYSDLDINGHFNSVKYIEHLLNMFDIDQYMSHTIKRFEIAYMAEGKYGMDLLLQKEKMDETNYVLAIKNNGRDICRSRIIWK